MQRRGETSGKDKPLVILMVQPWQRVSREKITQSFSSNPEISFPPLVEEDGTEGPMIIEAEIGGHFIHRINHMANETNTAASEDRCCGTFNVRFDELRRVLTLRSSRIIPLECMMVFGPEAQPFDVIRVAKEKIKVAIHSEHPEQTIAIGSTLTEEGRKALCELIRRNLDIFAWKPEDMTGFGLKNAGATYQRLVDKAFQKQIGKNLEVYVDDLVIKSRTEHEIIRGIEETFKTLREINMKLNPKKCTFGMEEGMFLGYKVNDKGIKVCSDKVEPVLSLSSPKCLKDVQKLNGKTMEAEAAFKQMKKLIAELPTLTAPMDKEELIVYLVTTKEAISVVLMTEREAKQMPIYFVSRVLQDFIVERPEDNPLDTPMEAEEELLDPWTLFTDKSSCVDSFRAGLILTNLEGTEFTYALRFMFDATNNEAEYEVLIAVANQVNGTYIAKELGMIHYLEKVKTLASNFRKFSIKRVPRSENKKADALSKIASTSFAHLTKKVLVEELNEKSINEAEVLAALEEKGDTWMTPIYEYLTKEALTAEKEKVYLPVPRNPQQKLTPIMSPLPFYKWEIDIVGPFPEGPGKVKFLIVAMDYFTKWIEAKPVATITETIHSKIGVKSYASANTLPPSSICKPMNDEALEINLDLLEERKEQAAIREARSKEKMEKYYNFKVRNRSFKHGYLVYRNNDASHAKDSGKLSPKWERPYEVTKALSSGAYKLMDQ
ncbi:reverse transcriptase domain-containing protein [Tanacetum coccineum]